MPIVMFGTSLCINKCKKIGCNRIVECNLYKSCHACSEKFKVCYKCGSCVGQRMYDEYVNWAAFERLDGISKFMEPLGPNDWLTIKF
jgi:hypothetical protein